MPNFNSLWADAKRELDLCSRNNYFLHLEAHPEIVLLQAIAYKVLCLNQRHAMDKERTHFSTDLSADYALTTSPITLDDYRRLFLDIADGDTYLFRNIYLEPDDEKDRFKVIYTLNEALEAGMADAGVQAKVLEVFNKNKGLGEHAPTTFIRTQPIAVACEITVKDAHRATTVDEQKLYEQVLKCLDDGLRPLPLRAADVVGLQIEGPRTDHPSVLEFPDIVKVLPDGLLDVESHDAKTGQTTRFRKEVKDYVISRLASAERQIAHLPYIGEVYLSTNSVVVSDPRTHAGSYVHFTIASRPGTASVARVGETSAAYGITVSSQDASVGVKVHLLGSAIRNSSGSLSANADAWLEKATPKQAPRREEKEDEVPPSHLLSLIHPVYLGKEGENEAWLALIACFDTLLHRFGGGVQFYDLASLIKNVKSQFSGGGSTRTEEVYWADWMMRNFGGRALARKFDKFMGAAGGTISSKKHEALLLAFLPDLLELMQKRNHSPINPSQDKHSLERTLDFLLCGGGKAINVKFSDVLVIDHSHFLNSSTPYVDDACKGLWIEVILASSGGGSLDEQKAMINAEVPMHLGLTLRMASASDVQGLRSLYESCASSGFSSNSENGAFYARLKSVPEMSEVREIIEYEIED